VSFIFFFFFSLQNSTFFVQYSLFIKKRRLEKLAGKISRILLSLHTIWIPIVQSGHSMLLDAPVDVVIPLKKWYCLSGTGVAPR